MFYHHTEKEIKINKDKEVNKEDIQQTVIEHNKQHRYRQIIF
jgi:hypothetical protein